MISPITLIILAFIFLTCIKKMNPKKLSQTIGSTSLNNSALLANYGRQRNVAPLAGYSVESLIRSLCHFFRGVSRLRQMA
jgi:hypothetical protein